MNSEIELTKLANKYQSDKGDQTSKHPKSKWIMPPHHYSRHYAKLFSKMRNDPITLLEIGLNVPHRIDCASLQMWLDFFPNAYIYGIDINPTFFLHKRATVYQGNQNDQNFWNEFLTKIPEPLDVIIDDASHYSLHQQKTLGNLFPQLKPGGIYIIEDLHFSTYKEKPTATLPTLLFLESLVIKNNKSLKEQTPIPHDQIDQLMSQIDSIEFFDSKSFGPHSFAAIKKCLR